MDLKEAFYKQKKELASAKTIIRRQTNRINELIKELKELNRIKRVGSNKTGYWEVTNNA